MGAKRARYNSKEDLKERILKNLAVNPRGMTIKEISVEIGLTRHNAYTGIYRVLQEMKEDGQVTYHKKPNKQRYLVKATNNSG